ncbi:MAG: hypothetical protein O4861_03635 [Trichodesmium sp. St16_bin4-tuft]|nr:hypothetical protein [Trichodesmium sp. St16_bin4-tuft]
MRVEIVSLEDIKELGGKLNDIYTVNRLVKIISFILVAATQLWPKVVRNKN